MLGSKFSRPTEEDIRRIESVYAVLKECPALVLVAGMSLHSLALNAATIWSLQVSQDVPGSQTLSSLKASFSALEAWRREAAMSPESLAASILISHEGITCGYATLLLPDARRFN
jgi:hypothetical protein